MAQLSFLPPKAVIGMVHFSALRGDTAFESDEIVLSRAMADLKALLDGGVDAVIFENNFDAKKFAKLPLASAEHFRELLAELVPKTTVPWGVAALWNDYVLGFQLCRELGGSMVRVPVFVDSVETVYGTFMANPDAVISARVEAKAESVAILADVQVKHARMLEPRPLVESVQVAIEKGADAVIITGTWTGEPPSVEDCREARVVALSHVAIFTGSGMTSENINDFLPHIDGCIVGSTFKKTSNTSIDTTKPNIVGADVRFDLSRIKKFVHCVKEYRSLQCN